MSTVKIPVVDLKGKAAGDLEGPASLFSIEPNEAAVHQVIKGQRARFHKKTATTKGRSDVNATKKKAYKQKGTGNARHGAKSSPIYVGGGIAFGPQNVNARYKINKKLYRLALASALSDKNSSGEVRVLKFGETEAKTKPIAELLKSLSYSNARVGFVVTNDSDTALNKSVRNIQKVDLLTEEKWTTFDFVKADTLIFSEDAFSKLSKRYAGAEG